MILLTKLASVFVFPLGLALAVILLGSLIAHAAAFRALVVVAAVLLWAAATPFVANHAEEAWTGEFRETGATDLPPADAIVVLGGFIAWVPSDVRTEPDLGDAVDRVFRAARLYRAGKAPLVVATGGNLPWVGGDVAEALLIRDVLVELGVPEDAVLVETESRNTRENAVNTAPVLDENGIDRVLLVTSARHMRRSLAVFAHAGIDAVPAPADFSSRSWQSGSILEFLPDANALVRTSSVLREALGLVAYRLRGWA